jgi:hypothetical protein
MVKKKQDQEIKDVNLEASKSIEENIPVKTFEPEIPPMPEAQEHVIENIGTNQTTENPIPENFDKNIYEVDSNGKPVLTPTGRMKKKKKIKSEINGFQSDIVPPVNNNEQQARALGIVIANTIVTICISTFGDEFQPAIVKSDKGDVLMDQRKNLEEAWGNYCIARNMVNFPPEIVVIIAMGSYLIPPLTRPKTKEKIKLGWLWLKNKFSKNKNAA